MKLHILDCIREYSDINPVRLHMPGHKGANIFDGLFAGFKEDLTELGFNDALESPSGIIQRAKIDIAEIIGAERSEILTDGSTCGVLSMICALIGRGENVLIDRNSHKSVYNALNLVSAKPVLFSSGFEEGLPLLPTAKEAEKIVSEKKISAIILTSPDYYGRVVDLPAFKEICSKKGILLLIDGAHGAHLPFFKRELYAGEYADCWVDGAHKTLPVLTQGALLNFKMKYEGRIERALSYFRTTSPSYPVMASVEAGVKYAYLNRNKFSDALKAIEKFKGGVYCKFLKSDDDFKLILDLKNSSLSEERVAKRMREKKIFYEFSDGRYVVMMLSPFADNSLDKLAKALDEEKENLYDWQEKKYLPKAIESFDYSGALLKETEEVYLSEAEGRISGVAAGLFPPCCPLVLPGERISAEIIEALKKRCAFGVRGGKISVVKKECE